MNLKTKGVLLSAAVFLCSSGFAAQPNVLLIMGDDVGWGDLSFYQRQHGAEQVAVETPNIDTLIAEGMRFSDAHSPASLCAPSRFSMLTGNWSYRNHKPFGVWKPEEKSGIDEAGFTTIARLAKAGGYQTAFFGKWGLGSSWLKKPFDWGTLDGGALHFGFDYACELPEGIQNRPYAFYENGRWLKLADDSEFQEIDARQSGYYDAKKLNDRGGMGDSNWHPQLAGPMLAKKGVDYIRSHAAQPFFIYYCSQAVHIPHKPPEALDGTSIAGTTRDAHTDMVKELDVQVGMLVRALKEAGVYENTLLVFTSDNGGIGKDSSAGLRGKKGSIMEGGHRIPFIAVWPGKIKAGSVSEEPIVGHDMVATLAALAGQPLDRTKVKDSVNLLPIFQGLEKTERHRWLMHQSAAGPSWAIREGDWKLILKASEKITDFKFKPEKLLAPGVMVPVGLYNLKTDLKETNNLINNPEYKAQADALLRRCMELRTTGAPTIGD